MNDTLTEKNKVIVRKYREAHNTNHLDPLDDIVAANLIMNKPIPGMPPGLEGAKLIHSVLVAVWPDIQTSTHELIAEGDKVVEHWTECGTHTGVAFMGVAASGKSFTMTGMSIYRIADGKIVEHWGNGDELSMFQQLGVIPPLAQGGSS